MEEEEQVDTVGGGWDQRQDMLVGQYRKREKN